MENGKMFIGVKTVRAKPMSRLEYNQLRGWTLPSNENGDDTGYLVEYTDGGKPNLDGYSGYVSWSPSDVFEKSYRKTSGLTFGLAIEAIKQGHKASRAGWNGKGMFVYYVPANCYPAQTGVAKNHFGENGFVPYNPYIAIKNVDETVSTWVPSINDVLAEDWLIE